MPPPLFASTMVMPVSSGRRCTRAVDPAPRPLHWRAAVPSNGSRMVIEDIAAGRRAFSEIVPRRTAGDQSRILTAADAQPHAWLTVPVPGLSVCADEELTDTVNPLAAESTISADRGATAQANATIAMLNVFIFESLSALLFRAPAGSFTRKTSELWCCAHGSPG